MSNKTIEEILAGYDSDDYSFEAVNEGPPAAEPEGPVHSDFSELLLRMEQKLDNISSSLNGATPEYISDIQALEGLILPLLVKLSKGDEPYIKWPGRSEQITNQIKRVLDITRKYVGE
jgi:hypothetical protein